MTSNNYPGSKIGKTRKVQYNAVYNELRRQLSDDPTGRSLFTPLSKEDRRLTCNCETAAFKKKSAPNPSSNPSRYLQYSHMMRNYTYYGKVQYANATEGTQLKVNYLGKTEGQPGGSGGPPKNRLR